jgi:hypothetical protein
MAPIAPAPFVPEVFTPLKLITIIEALTLCESVAVTVMLLTAVVANARQISEVPLCPFVRTTRAQARPPPEMLVTVVFVPPR